MQKLETVENIDIVERERERESGTLENKALLSERKKYKIKRDSSTIFVSREDTR